jgi:hypothetical protein
METAMANPVNECVCLNSGPGLQAAMTALHSVLVAARARAAQTGDKKLHALLDGAELLPKLVLHPGSERAFREVLEGLQRDFPELSVLAVDFEDASR